LYLMTDELFLKGEHEKIIIIRSAVSGRNQGFLPGSEKEKMQVYEEPYRNIFKDIFGRSDAYEILKKKGIVSFESTSFLRGVTFDNSLIIVDEFQNCNFAELDSIITRVGNGSRICFAGDYKQTDFDGKKEVSGFKEFVEVLGNMKSFETVDFTIEDVVRSGLVKEYLIAKDKCNI